MLEEGVGKKAPRTWRTTIAPKSKQKGTRSIFERFLEKIKSARTSSPFA